MQFIYPILQVLLYVAVLLAPPDADRISITGPDISCELTRSGDGWEFIDDGITSKVSTEKGALIIERNGKRESMPVMDLVKAAVDHDWSKAPKVSMEYGSTLEKTADGFVLRTDDGKPEMKEYRITWHPRGEKAAGIRVNVLGAVEKPGAYSLAANASVTDAVNAAGGVADRADRDHTRVLRGTPGTAQKVIMGLESPLSDRDTVYVPLRESADSSSPAPAGTFREYAVNKTFEELARTPNPQTPEEIQAAAAMYEGDTATMLRRYVIGLPTYPAGSLSITQTEKGRADTRATEVLRTVIYHEDLAVVIFRQAGKIMSVAHGRRDGQWKIFAEPDLPEAATEAEAVANFKAKAPEFYAALQKLPAKPPGYFEEAGKEQATAMGEMMNTMTEQLTKSMGEVADGMLEQMPGMVKGLQESVEKMERTMQTPGATGKTSKPVLITVAEDGALTFAGEPCSVEQLSAKLAALSASGPAAVEIQADRSTAFKHVAAVTDACKSAGIDNVTFRGPGKQESSSSKDDSPSGDLQFRWLAAEGDTTSPADVLPDPADPSGKTTLRVLREAVLSSDDVESAEVSKSDDKSMEIQVALTRAGGKKFARATEENISRRLAIVWNGSVISAPVVQEPIRGGKVTITGRFTDAEVAEMLASQNRPPAVSALERINAASEAFKKGHASRGEFEVLRPLLTRGMTLGEVEELLGKNHGRNADRIGTEEWEYPLAEGGALTLNFEKRTLVAAKLGDLEIPLEDPIAVLTDRLNATHGLWINGLSPSLNLPAEATSEEVLKRVMERYGFDSGSAKNYRVLQTRTDWPINAGMPEGKDRFTAVLAITDSGQKIVLFRRSADDWWCRVYDAPLAETKQATEESAVSDPVFTLRWVAKPGDADAIELADATKGRVTHPDGQVEEGHLKVSRTWLLEPSMISTVGWNQWKGYDKSLFLTLKNESDMLALQKATNARLGDEMAVVWQGVVIGVFKVEKPLSNGLKIPLQLGDKDASALEKQLKAATE